MGRLRRGFCQAITSKYRCQDHRNKPLRILRNRRRPIQTKPQPPAGRLPNLLKNNRIQDGTTRQTMVHQKALSSIRSPKHVFDNKSALADFPYYGISFLRRPAPATATAARTPRPLTPTLPTLRVGVCASVLSAQRRPQIAR
jgi:hypothetical protein